MVHFKPAVFPGLIPDTELFPEVTLFILATELITFHSPVPTCGAFASNTKFSSLHWLWSTPAFAVDGAGSTFIVIFSESVQPFKVSVPLTV